MTNNKLCASAILVSGGLHVDATIGDLGTGVDDDAFAISSVLQDTGGYADEDIHHILGADATSEIISRTIQSATANLGPDDPFFFYFSGHGAPTSNGTTLLTYDYDYGLVNTGYRTADLVRDLAGIPSRRKFLIVDACFAGGVGPLGGQTKGKLTSPVDALRELSMGEGTVLMASSRETEESLILPGDTLSLFTKHIVNALQGGAESDHDGFIRVFDLFNYVAEHVRNDAPQQSPVYAAHQQDRNFAVAYSPPDGHRSKVSTREQSHQDNYSIENSDLFSLLYPLGPTEREIWFRAGGDISRLSLSDTPRTMWVRALRDIERGAEVTLEALVNAAMDDYPFNRKLEALI